MTTKFEYPIENQISNPSEILNIAYDYNHYYLMISIRSNKNIPPPPLPLDINTTAISKPTYDFGIGSSSKLLSKKRKNSSSSLNPLKKIKTLSNLKQAKLYFHLLINSKKDSYLEKILDLKLTLKILIIYY